MPRHDARKGRLAGLRLCPLRRPAGVARGMPSLVLAQHHRITSATAAIRSSLPPAEHRPAPVGLDNPVDPPASTGLASLNIIARRAAHSKTAYRSWGQAGRCLDLCHSATTCVHDGDLGSNRPLRDNGSVMAAGDLVVAMALAVCIAPLVYIVDGVAWGATRGLWPAPPPRC